jgi:transmembrane serine protease 3
MRWMMGVVAAVGLLGCGGPELDTDAVDAVDSLQQEIVGGVEAVPHQFPWMVSLQIGTSHYCGGSILNSTTVITAAHCVYEDPSDLRIVAGAHNLLQLGASATIHSAQDIRIHGNYSPDFIPYDIALIKVTPPIDLTTSPGTRASIGLVTPTDVTNGLMAPDVMATTAGWGVLQENSFSYSTNLMKVSLPILSDTTMSQAYPFDFMPARMVGAGYLAGGKDSC